MTSNTNSSGASEHPGVVVLTVPATPRHAATARVVAASLAADLGFGVDEIDDLRLGLNEAVAVLADHRDDDAVDRADGDEGDHGDESDDEDEGGIADDRLRIEFRTVPAGSTPARIDVVVHRGERGGAPADLDELAERILSAVVDHHEHREGAIQLSKSSRGPG